MAKGIRTFKSTKNANPETAQTIILIAVLLALIVIIGGALIFVIMSKGGIPMPPPANNTNQSGPPIIIPQNVTVANNTNVTSTCDDPCHLAAALRERNFTECSLVQDKTLSQDCALQLSNGSLDACRALSGANEAAKNACLLKFASAKNDSSLCSLLPDPLKSGCLALFNPCSSAQDKNLCQAINDRDPGECDNDPACIMNYSITTGDSSACGNLTEIVKSKACSSATLLTDKCADLTLDSQKNYCYELYAIYSDNPLVCTQINGDNVYSLDCVSYFAGKRKDLSICEKDSLSLNTLWACYINYSLITGDISGCAKIAPLATSNKFTCAFEYAIKFGDPTACQLITDSLNQRSTCYQGAIIYSNQNLDWTKCAGVVNIDWKNSCYTESAKLRSDISLCDKIESDYGRTSCRDSYALYQNSTSAQVP